MEDAFRDAPAGLRIIETFRAGPVTHVAPHLVRLASTAARMGFRHDAAAVARAVAGLPTGAHRVRLMLGPDGDVSVETAALRPVAAPWRVTVAAARVGAGDPWRSVKTTHRGIYDAARAAMAPGIDEVLFLNDRGRLAEGAITNLFVPRDGRLVTPPVADGALPGVLRARLLATGRAVEGPVAPGDLSGPFFLGNALRGLIPARLA